MSNGHALPVKDRLVVSGEPTPHRVLRAQGRPVVSKFKHHHEGNPHHHPPPPPRKSDANTSLRETCADIYARVERFLSAPAPDAVTRGTQEQTRVAISVITQALQEYEFEALSLSYNGGKDCLVLLILYLSVLHTHFTQPSGRRKRSSAAAAAAETEANTAAAPPQEEKEEEKVEVVEDSEKDFFFPTSIPSIYAKPPDPFDAVSEFVEESTQDYHLDLTHITTNPGPSQQSKSHSSPPITQTEFSSVEAVAATATNGDLNNNHNHHHHHHNSSSSSSTPSHQPHQLQDLPIISFRDAFAIYLQTHPHVRAIFVGTRRTDPHGASLRPFQMTDGRWPRFMRVHPVIDWRLSQVWCFLRSPCLADPLTKEPVTYCAMYDQGYTSLGGVGDTVPNPRLKRLDPQTGAITYRPAYEMVEDDEERAGRE